MIYDFLVETYETERIKVLSVWSEFRDADLPFRPRAGDPRGRSVHEQMVHQCVSEDLWFRTMIGIDVGAPPLPSPETRLEFIRRYAEDSGKRLEALRGKKEDWWVGDGNIFRIAEVAGLDCDAADFAYFASSRAADGYVADVGARFA